ncbi:ankyrin repeat-containing protein [Tanacetum coccineum]
MITEDMKRFEGLWYNPTIDMVKFCYDTTLSPWFKEEPVKCEKTKKVEGGCDHAKEENPQEHDGSSKKGLGVAAHNIFMQPPSVSDINHGQRNSYIHDFNLSLAVGGVSGQAPSISDMARDNMSSQGTHSYSRDQSAPSWNAFNKRDSSTLMTDTDDVQEFVGDEQKFTIREISPEWVYATEPTKVLIVGIFMCNPFNNEWKCMFGDTEVPVEIIQEGVMSCHPPLHTPGKVTICITSGNREACSEIGMSLASESSLTIAQEQKFTIREISPEWVYVTEPSKVLIVGTFTCDPLNNEWICMFGDTEVPVEIIQEGGISSHAPPHTPGKVTICITSGNREACSEVREFEYRDKPHMHMHNTSTENEISRRSEELRLLVRFVQTLLCDKIGQKGKSNGPGYVESSIASEDSWNQIIEDNNTLPVLSKGEHGIIHMISGLGFVWALAPILKSGVGINFRDANGWTALHWASRFGREKMVTEILASGAYPGAVTDPSQQNLIGKTRASIAETYGHKGLAGYLSDVALTSHLSSLTLKESELSKCSADVEAERTVNSISNQNLVVEDHLSLKDAIAAVRNAAQTALHEYGILPSEIEALSAVSKLTFGNARHHNAALAIQKKYRGWKGRKDYLTLRKKAHVRGHQARKNYEAICWAVGIVEKIILRWHRKRVSLRGFHLDSIDESADEDIAKVFRKQRVDVALAEAVSRVLSMAEQGGWENKVGTTSQLDTAAGLETEELLDFV